ncbi:MAG TPA: FAD-binding oxidoreductase, partial [Dehalococcoidia bacterium]|nr:FAD-binding oxidoreductase [Dehalococcoidia bacterium]
MATSHLTHAVESLAGRLRGELIRPDDPGYDVARRVWNGMIDRHPALIVRAAAVDDVVAGVNFAREQGLLVSVRGGGHNVAGHATNDGGLVIDLSAMKKISMDPQARVARAEGGVTWGELDAAAQVHGLATPGGVFSDTGIAGLTLGGGFGWIRNKYGLSADNLVGAEVVTADGKVVRASANEHPDLLWALRGGGGNFGVVTTFEFSLHPLGPEVFMVFAFHDGSGDAMKKAIQYYGDYSTTAPDEVSTLLAVGQIPPIEIFPNEIHMRPFVLFGGVYAGPVEDGKRVLQPMISFAEPLVDHSGVMPYVDAQKMFDEDYPNGMRYYWKSLNLTRLDDDVIDVIVKHARKQPSPLSTIDLWQVGGAVARGGDGAFYGRQAAFLLSPEANWEDPADDEANISWLRALIADAEQFSDGSRYLNFPGLQEEGETMMRQAYGARYDRLVRLKQKYDPNNLFRLNQN